MTTSNSESSHDFDYPPVQVHGSLTSTNLNQLIMSSQARRPPDEASSSLEDSPYEVLSDSLYEAVSDDGAHTESLASTDIQTPDDIASLDSNESDDEDIDYIPEHSHTGQHPGDSIVGLQPNTSPGESMITSQADTQLAESSYLKILEEVMPGHRHATGCGVIREFDAVQELPTVFQRYGCPEIRLTVRLGLADALLSISRPFRILYVGQLETWEKQEITRHIGHALHASPRSSMYSVVPGPAYGEGTSISRPELCPSGPQIFVDQCTAPRFLGASGRSDSASLLLDNGTVLRLSQGKASPADVKSSLAPVPDLVVFHHAAVASSAQEQQQLRRTREMLGQNKIPCIDISMTRLFGVHNSTGLPDADKLWLCVEGRAEHAQEYDVLETLPIDVYAFLQIDPTQLNRHLACISKFWEGNQPGFSRPIIRAVTRHSNHDDAETSRWSLKKLIPKNVRSSSSWQWREHEKQYLSALSLLVLLVAYFVTSATIPAVLQHAPKVQEGTARSTSTDKMIPTPSELASSKVTSEVPQISISTQSPTASAISDLTVVPSEESSSSKKRAPKAPPKEDSYGGYEIYVRDPADTHQFVLRPTEQLSKRKRRPQLQVLVTQDFKSVPVNVLRSNDGSYIIELVDKYPLGEFTVSIVTRPKPLLQQTFIITMGYRMSSLAFLKGKAMQQLAIAHANWKALSARIHEFSGDVDGLVQVQEELVRLVKAETEAARKLGQSGFQLAREMTAPMRTHPALLKARQHALDIRQRVEEAIEKATEGQVKRGFRSQRKASSCGCKKSKTKFSRCASKK